MRLKGTVSRNPSSLALSLGVIITRWNQNVSPQKWWYSNSPSKKKFQCSHQWVKVGALSFRIEKSAILLDLLETRQTINYVYSAWISIFKHEKKTISCLHHKVISLVANFGWMILLYSLYNPDLEPSKFHLLRPMKNGTSSR